MSAKKTTHNIRTEKELAEDFELICRYRKQGYGWRTIARKINEQRRYEIDFKVYYRQYHNVVTKTLEEAKLEKEDLINAELSEIDWQIAELQKAWEASIGRMEKKTIKSGEGKEGNDKSGIQIVEWEENGDPRYMSEITRLRERRAKLLGIDAPEKKEVEHSGKVNWYLPKPDDIDG